MRPDDEYSARERFARESEAHYDGSRTLYTAGLAICVFLLLFAVSAWQITASGPATRMLESGIATLTEVDTVIAEQRPALEQTAGNQPAAAYVIPGYPLDVRLTRDEALRAGPDELRRAVLQRSAALVYTDGLRAFDRTGHQSLSLFSTKGLLERVTGQLNEDAHRDALIATAVLGVLTAAATAMVVLRNNGFGRVRALGLGVFAGALPGLLIAVLLRLLSGEVGGDGDTFGAGFHDVTYELLDVFLRNYAAAAALGAALFAAGVLFALIARKLPSGGGLDDGFTTA